MLFNITIIYIVFIFIIVAASYYIDLFMKKDEFTKNDIKSLMPHFNAMWSRYSQKYPPVTFLVVFIVSSFLSILLTLSTSNIIMNSAILFIMLYFFLPVISNNIEKSRVIESDNYSDYAANIIVKFNDVIVLGYAAGSGAALVFSWGALRHISFFWFILNLVIVIILAEIKIRQINLQ